MAGGFMDDTLWLHKVPSPTGSDDSGVGLSPGPTAAGDFTLQQEIPFKSNFFLKSSVGEETIRLYNSDEQKLPISQSDAPDTKSFQPNIRFDNQLSKELINLASSNDWIGPDIDLTYSQEEKARNSRKSSKRKKSAKDNSPRSKFERCLEPKTGNGRPRKTSQKRKMSQKKRVPNAARVEVKTVRQQLENLRRERANNPRLAISPYPRAIRPCATAPTSIVQQRQMYASVTVPQHVEPHVLLERGRHQESRMLVHQPTSAMETFGFPYDSPDLRHTLNPVLPLEPDPSSVGKIMIPDLVPRTFSSSISFSTPICEQQAMYDVVSHPNVTLSPVHTPPYNQSASSPIYAPLNPLSPPATYESYQQRQEAVSYAGFDTDPAVIYQESYTAETNQSAYDSPTAEILQYASSSCYDDSNEDISDLFENAYLGNIKPLQEVLARRPDLANTRHSTGMTPIFFAIKNNQLDSTRMLLQYGASASYILPDGATTMHFAAKHSTTEILELLMVNLDPAKASELINKTGCQTGLTPLHIATESGHIRTMEKLMQFGANFLSQDLKNGHSPLHIAVKKANIDAAASLIKFAQVSPETVGQMTCQKTHNENTALHFAAELTSIQHCDNRRLGQIQKALITLLLDNQADPFMKNSERKLPGDLLPSAANCYEIQQLHQLLRSGRRQGTGLQQSILPPGSLDFNRPPLHQGSTGSGFPK